MLCTHRSMGKLPHIIIILLPFAHFCDFVNIPPTCHFYIIVSLFSFRRCISWWSGKTVKLVEIPKYHVICVSFSKICCFCYFVSINFVNFINVLYYLYIFSVHVPRQYTCPFSLVNLGWDPRSQYFFSFKVLGDFLYFVAYIGMGVLCEWHQNFSFLIPFVWNWIVTILSPFSL